MQRNLYLHLYFTDLTRFGQYDKFQTIEQLAQNVNLFGADGDQ